MAALSIDYDMGSGGLVVTDAAGAAHDLTGIALLGGNTLAYDTDGNVIIRVGLATATIVVTPPAGAALTFDKRLGTALKRLGITVPTF